MNEVIKPEEYNLDKKQAEEITKDLKSIVNQRDVLAKVYEEVIRMDINDPKTSKAAREARLKIRDNRTKAILPWHKTHKEYFLRGGQFLDAVKNKEIRVNEKMEEDLEAIEKHYENLEKERKEKLNQERKELILVLVSDLPEEQYSLPPFGDMDEEVFQAYYDVRKKKRVERDQAKAEVERLRLEEEKKQQLNESRKQELLPFWDLVEDKTQDFSNIHENEFKKYLNYLSDIKAEKELELKKSKLEAKKKEAELEKIRQEQEKQNKIREARSKELQPYIVFIRDYNDLMSKEEKEYQKEFADIKKGAELQWEYDRKQREKDAKVQQQKDAELVKLQKEKEETEKLKADEAKNLNLEKWVDSFQLPVSTNDLPDSDKKKEIIAKFFAFKNWANKL